MKRTLFSFAAVLLLTTSGLAAAQSEQPTPEGTSNQEQAGTMDQQPSTTPDQPAATPTDPSTSSTLPSTATPLPLMGLGGLVSLAAGAWLARPRRKS